MAGTKSLLTLLAVGIISTCLAAESILPQIGIPFMKKPPVLDGKIEEPEWSEAARMVGFVSQHNLELTPREGIFWVGADRENLYIAIKSQVAPDGQLLTRAVADGDRDIVAAVYDDSIELVIHPHLGKTSGDRRYFHIICNARGAMYDRSFDESNQQNPVNTAWRLKNWVFTNSIIDNFWHVEISIPFTEIGALPEDLNHPWGLRVCRNWQRGWDQSRWENATSAYEDVPTMPRVSFNDKFPVVQVIKLEEAGKPSMEVTVSARQSLPVKVFISDTWSHNPPAEKTWEKTILAGQKETFVLQPPHGGPEGSHRTLIRVSSPDEKEIYYLREFRWRLEKPEDCWTLAKEEKKAVALHYKIYPGYNRMKVKVDISALATREKVTGANLILRKQGTDQAIFSRALVFQGTQAELVTEIPPLQEGNYEIVVSLQGEKGIPEEPIVGLYERKVFPWENNKLGLSERVIPPFTPIEIKGKSLFTVLREHRLNEAGLWDQVISRGRPLLAGPMKWKVTAAGQEVQVSSGKFSILSHKPWQVVTAGSFSAGEVQAQVKTEWDYDGMAKITLSLKPSPGKEIDGLSLEIPLQNSEVPYMHACGDGLRHNYAGKTPQGQGLIWNSNQANKINIIGPFYPYLWLGGGERGLAWFADTDLDWSLEEKKPALELIRNGETVILKVNFVTRQTKLDRQRNIVFGLQATPVKPMPENPVNWRRWLCRYYQHPKTQPFTILGSSPYYGALHFGFYPLDKDFSIYEAFDRARETGIFDNAFVEKWMEKYKRFVQPGTEKWTFYLNHINAGMRTAAGTPRSQGWLLTPYTNPRGIDFSMEEWPTFQDEWIQFSYFQRQKEGAVAYEICPVKSFQDAALWYYREMMKCFDGIYWDNLYLAANYDTVAGGAWVDEKGRIHPSLGLWAMRDLVKRTAVLFHECGRPVFLNVVHMTNANLVPVLSFANVSLDWEWQYGKRDFQDRFTPELTVAETIGRHCGNIPLILAGGFYDSKDPDYARVMRTRLGVCLVHELKVWDWGPAFHYDFLKKLYEFGYGEKDCHVYNYWEENFPVSIKGVDARGIVMQKEGKTLVIITDYGQGGQAEVKLDGKILKLPENLKCHDFETGEEIKITSTGEIIFTLNKHDFRALLLE